MFVMQVFLKKKFQRGMSCQHIESVSDLRILPPFLQDFVHIEKWNKDDIEKILPTPDFQSFFKKVLIVIISLKG